MKVNKDTYCVMAHRGFFIQPDKKVKPCCVFKEFEEPLYYDETKSFDELFNSTQFQDLRQKLSDGVKYDGCSDCWGGRSSHREGMNRMYSAPSFDFTPSLTEKDIYYLDLRISNLCNFKCRMCNPTYSSSWGDEMKKYSKEYFWSEPTQRIIKGEWMTPLINNLDKVTNIYLGGGEPIIMKETYELLDALKERSEHISLFINTNLSTLTYKKNHILEAVKDFRQCQWFISCDGLNEIGEYQRTGFKTDVFFKNMDELVNSIAGQSKFSYKIIYAISNINIFDVFNTYHTIKDRYDNDQLTLDFQIVDNPWTFSIRNCSNKFKDRVRKFIADNRDSIKDQDTQTRLDALLDFISNDNSIPDCDENTNRISLMMEMDKVRNENLFKVAPWLREEYDFFKSKKWIDPKTL